MPDETGKRGYRGLPPPEDRVDPDPSTSLYTALIETVFLDRYRKGATSVPFDRDALPAAAAALGRPAPKNVGDVVYAYRSRKRLPDAIVETQPEGMEWVIEGAGHGRYVFKLVPVTRIGPNPDLIAIKIPDATPEIVSAYALSDEQALLARIRYNRLIDIFLGIAAFSLQNHLRTTVRDIGQIEIDEIYVGVDSGGRQYVIPVQAKGGTDRISRVQTRQDIRCCLEKFPDLVCRSISTRFMHDDLIAMFELTMVDDEVKIVAERHYRLVQADRITPDDLKSYSIRS